MAEEWEKEIHEMKVKMMKKIAETILGECEPSLIYELVSAYEKLYKLGL